MKKTGLVCLFVIGLTTSTLGVYASDLTPWMWWFLTSDNLNYSVAGTVDFAEGGDIDGDGRLDSNDAIRIDLIITTEDETLTGVEIIVASGVGTGGGVLGDIPPNTTLTADPGFAILPSYSGRAGGYIEFTILADELSRLFQIGPINNGDTMSQFGLIPATLLY